MPLYEINIDCWNTSKGETQSKVHFKPIDEVKASAASRLARSHVISDHPGFDSCLSVGSITLGFHHNLVTDQNEQKSHSQQQSLEIKSESNLDSLPNEDNFIQNFNQNLTEKIVDELVEQNKLKLEFKKELSDPQANQAAFVDDGSIHKFTSIQFNEIVICEFCNKKVNKKKLFFYYFKKIFNDLDLNKI